MQLNESTQALKTELKRVMNEVETLQNITLGHQKTIESNQKSIDVLQNINLGQQKTIGDKDNQILRLNESTQALETELKRVINEVDTLQNITLGHQKTIESNQKSIEVLQNINLGQQKTIGDKDNQILRLNESTQALETELKRVINEVDTLQNITLGHQKTIESNQKSIEVLQNINLGQQKTIESNQKSIDVLQNITLGHQKTIEQRDSQTLRLNETNRAVDDQLKQTMKKGDISQFVSIKESILSSLNHLKEETWYNLRHPDMNSQFRLDIALQLLTIVDWVHMGVSPDQCTLYKEAEKKNIHIKRPHFYSPLPILSQLPNHIWDQEWNQGINWNENVGLELLEDLIIYSVEYKDLTDSRQFDIVYQNAFKHLDSALYYALIRHFKPKRIIEVGAGHSTEIASLARLKNASGEIIAIEPNPPECLKNGSLSALSLIQKPVQEISIDVFKQLHENDILFIDSSHVCKIGSDVNYLFLEVIPQLKKGVLIHVHDVFLPLSYPRRWVEELDLFWNEQYILHAFLIGNRNFEILIGNNYMVTKHPERIARLFDQSNKYNGLAGSSFWIRKK